MLGVPKKLPSLVSPFLMNLQAFTSLETSVVCLGQCVQKLLVKRGRQYVKALVSCETALKISLCCSTKHVLGCREFYLATALSVLFHMAASSRLESSTFMRYTSSVQQLCLNSV